MEETTGQILYETKHHASRPFISNYPPLNHQQLNEGANNSYISRLLSSSGIAQLKERWRKHGNPTKVRRCASLFVSPRGDLVAVASGNQITILQKVDEYQKPRGIFNCKSITSFRCGAWSETHDVLGVADDSDTIYLIRANGEEITRISKSHIKSSSPIVGLMVQDDVDLKKSCLCTFTIITADGLIHDIEISQDPSASVFSPLASRSGTMLKHSPQDMICLDYQPELSLFSIVSSAGSLQLTTNGLYSLSLCWKSGNLALEVLVSTQFEGFFSIPKDYVGHITSPKVSISPRGRFVAALDMGGSLNTFKFDKEQRALSKCSYGEGNELHQGNKDSDKGNILVNGVIDFAWWSDDILAVAEMNGNITMINICTGAMLCKKDGTMYSLPLLERVPQMLGKLFLLETKPSVQNNESTKEIRESSFHLMECDRGDMNNKFDWANFQWSLVSFSERSIPEMYDILISRQEYQAALMFADQHGLDKDEALKSHWLHSSQGVNEIKALLSNIKDHVFVLSECVGRFGPTEDAVRALLDLGLSITDRYRFSEPEVDDHSKVWDCLVARLMLLQYRDRLETFLGINMGRFSLQEFKKFCNLPIKEAAIALAESGKIGALNLLFKRHPYSLTSSLLDVFAAIPETLPVQTYGQLLPGSSPPPSMSLREEDWVECDEMVTFIISRVPESHESYAQIRTEPIVKQFLGSQWPSVSELSSWYKKRARDIDTLSGQLDNSMCLIDFACRKGISQLQPFLEEISYLHQLIYSEENEEMNFSMSLTIWESLPDYEKFKLMLIGVREDTVITRLHSKAIPFMKKRFHSSTVPSGDEKTDCSAESFLVRWLKEIASEKKLEMCSIVIEEGVREVHNNNLFHNEAEVVDCALQCIYACSVTDRWSTMTSILSKLPFPRDSEAARLKERLRLAEGHIEAGRILALYQVPKPISFFQDAYCDEKGVKQIIRLILSKFVRRQPGRSDNDWTNMWLDLQSLLEKAFFFIDLEYVLMEFCRGLLKAGKFSLARNYLKGVGSVSLANDKAENLVIQAAREYFFSASSLSSSEIWKAKECLNIFPTSRNVRAEADIIDAVTVRLPNLGVTLLPMQFRQIKDPMEIVKLVVTSQGGAYLNVDEIIELAKLLRLSSHDDISAVQEAIAREAAVVGDLQLAFDLCLVLAKKGYGSVWDLCAALARGPALENMDIASRKHLLGFALSHCDGESIAELLHAWKDLDMQDQCESLMVLTGTEPNENNVEALAKMVKNLVSVLDGPVPDGLLSWQYVYKHHVLSLLTELEARAKPEVDFQSSESLHGLISEIEQTYNSCCKYLKFVPNPARLDIVKRFLSIILPADGSFKSFPCGSVWRVGLAMLVDTWIRMMNDMHEVALLENSEERFCLECIMKCLQVFARLVAGEKVSSSQGWATVFGYVGYVLVGDVAAEIFNFCRAMICSGCCFGAVADIYDEVMAHFQREAGSVADFKKEAFSIQNLRDLYLSILKTILQELTDESREHQCLHYYLSSLSKLAGDLDNLQSVRQAVWERLEEFSENFRLPNHVRVYILELMQLIAASDKNSKGFSSKLKVEVHSWEGWENTHNATANCENAAADGISNKVDASNKFTNTLIALKSTQLVSTISPSIEITPDDLSTVESTVSCFLGVSKFAESESHIETLLVILVEWDGHFTRGEIEMDSGEVSDGGNGWGNDDWDEGWESFQEPIEEEPKKSAKLSVHPLHICWMEIFRKLLTISHYNKMLKLLDKSVANPGEVLLDEENARTLSQITLEIDCFLALKLMLLLPYEAVQLQCLDSVEQKLKQEGISDKLGVDLEFLLVVLSSGIISTIITKPSFGTVFSYICYTVGNFSRQCQESQLSSSGHGGSVESENISKDHVDLFTRVIFPCFVSELVRSGQQILAGFLVTKLMHTNPSLSLINIAGACLTKYLERQIQILQDSNLSFRDGVGLSEPLLNTISSLRDRMGNLIQPSLSALSHDHR